MRTEKKKYDWYQVTYNPEALNILKVVEGPGAPE